MAQADAPLRSHADLAQALLAAVREQDFAATPDNWRGGAPVAHFPSIDLAVCRFAKDRPPLWANVLFSREHPQGVAAGIAADAGALTEIRFDKDIVDAKLDSIAWLPDANWQHLPWTLLHGQGKRFVAPYPASVLKLMVAIGLGLAVDRGLCRWPAALEPMIAVSDNDATTDCVALLHRAGMIEALNRHFIELALPTLQLHGTRADGGWRNKDGAGVGQIHMTAWDTLRLLWLLDGQAPVPRWLPAGSALLQPATCEHLLLMLRRQQLDQVLSSGSLRDVPGWVRGLPDAPAFAHKTGNTDNYAADAGIVDSADGCHYIVAVFTSLGGRYAPHERCATTWRLPALGAAIHRLMESAA